VNLETSTKKASLIYKENTHEHFAEIIQSNLQSYTAQCWRWDNFPRFGSLVQAQSGQVLVIGCVSQISTGSTDPMRSPFPYQKTEAELMAEQPQIFEFLRTTFNVQIIGYIDDTQKKVNYNLAPTPSKIHSFVKVCDLDVVAKFFQEPLYLHILFAAIGQNPNFDDLLLALLSNLSGAGLLTKSMLDDFCKTFSLLSGNDYRRLKLFLKRVEKIAE
jgi:hypothetical protein